MEPGAASYPSPTLRAVTGTVPAVPSPFPFPFPFHGRGSVSPGPLHCWDSGAARGSLLERQRQGASPGEGLSAPHGHSRGTNPHSQGICWLCRVPGTQFCAISAHPSPRASPGSPLAKAQDECGEEGALVRAGIPKGCWLWEHPKGFPAGSGF